MASVEESVSTTKRKGDGQRELQEAGKSKKRSTVYLYTSFVALWGGRK